MMRKIIHLDMDAFYAAIEQRDCPEYRGKPIVVGGSPDKRGVVATCSYEARKFGIHSAMPSAHAYRLCPQAIFLRPRFEVYRQVSTQIRGVFHAFTDIVEPLSLDEAYLDVSEVHDYRGSATLIAQAVKDRIRETTGLTGSAGVSYNKFLAKIASDMDKPDGLTVVTPERARDLIEGLPIARFHGVGKVTEAKMKALGIHTGGDLAKWSERELQRAFGKMGRYYHNAARGIDERAVQHRRVRKSIGSETTFEHDLAEFDEMLAELRRRGEEVGADLAAKGLCGRTLTVKVKYDNFEQVTRSKTALIPFAVAQDIVSVLPELLVKTEAGRRRVRLLGVTVSNLAPTASEVAADQLELL